MRRIGLIDSLVFLLLVIAIIVIASLGLSSLFDKAAFVFSLAALGISIMGSYLTVIRPILMKPKLEWYRNIQPSSPTNAEVESYGAKMSWFMRLKVVNNGLMPAKNCVGRLIEVKDENGKRLDKFDPFTLYWARQNINNKFSPIDIQGNGDFFFLDVAQLEEKKSRLCLRVVTNNERLVSEPELPTGTDPECYGELPEGIYFLRIGIYAEEDVYIEPTWVMIKGKVGDPDEPCIIEFNEPPPY